ncbi:MAG: phosphotransferase family protein [Halieaceae bacterium]|jgi:aminoglycoside phosphotransferase (APT) family kinase protein|nr:phosphotransferase family protein [Halieaceae bacterium]
MSARQAEGYDIPAVEEWIGNNIDGLTPPFEWTRLEGGHSNLTYKLEDASGRQAVVRRPPQGVLLPKAHDMSREWSLISGLGPTAVPVPQALGFCEDPEVTGAWFYVMGLIDGRPLYNTEQVLAWVPEERRATLAYSFFDVLADLHSLVPDEVGLGELGKKENYVGRQLKTWYRSWNASVEPAQYDDPRAHELQQYFLDHMPEQGMARVVHGDYGLHNCLIGADSTIAAVVDWEISTLGDPLADMAYALCPWPQPGDGNPADPQLATGAPGFPPRDELAQRYAARTGRNLDKLDYYIGFNRWKSAAIVHGVYARYKVGQKSTEGVDLDALHGRIDQCLGWAEDAVNRLRK